MIDPRGLDVIGWSDAMAFSINRFGYVDRLDDPLRWKDWAEQVVTLKDIASQSPPDPRDYDDWSVWADRLNMIVGLGD